MGREAFLTRLSLGRSAYEPPEPAAGSSRAPGRGGADSDGALRTGQTPPHEEAGHQRRYDDRGRPVNPESRALDRELRAAQNDVLAAVGVVERNKIRNPSRAAIFPQQKDAQVVERVKTEEFCGTLVAIFGTLLRYSGVWWVNALLDRIMVYRYPDDLSFAEIVALQYRAVGPMTFFFAGLPAQLLSMITNDGDNWASLLIACLNEALYRAKASRATVKRVQRWKPWIRSIISWSIEVAFSPILVHAAGQRLLLIPASQTLPPLESFIPFSATSPLKFGQPLKPWNRQHFRINLLKMILSPAVFVTAWRQEMMKIQRDMYEPLERGILTPDNPDIYTIDEATERRRARKARVQRKQRSAKHKWARRFLASLGWTRHSSSEEPAVLPSDGRTESMNSEMAGTEGSGPPPHEVAAGASTDDGSGRAIGQTGQQHGMDPMTPLESPTEGTRNAWRRPDATVRIASRDEGSGVVSLEIRLPEVLQQEAAASRDGSGMDQGSDHGANSRRLHRVTQLAGEPAEMLGSLVNYTFAELVLLPLKAVGLRHVAVSVASMLLLRHAPPALVRSGARAIVEQWPDPASWLTRRNGIYLGRVALCCGLEMLAGLSIWGIECVAVTVLGRRWFGWR
ncbi:hypothetical protein K490DRAFT_61955 [Saccharata proteae CBS 121410]|uniref:Uncharacterized protein n=1 Tax=Saccharata proteae CBS 121410 TaxID=1314787 RepID=A0A9P4I0Q6_9PEZI|nr:hypothetical protein K490DRAFT_61955 [Saccharata proteae CBS 121410]